MDLTRMKRSKPLKRVPFRRKEPTYSKEPHPLMELEGDAALSAAAFPRIQSLRKSTYSGTTTGAVPKTPATRSQALRDLAEGEHCSVCEGLYCDPATTVWAHTNAIADGKGMGHKSSDHLGFFAGHYCHARIDQGGVPEAEAKRLVAQAQDRTRQRLAEIAGNPLAKPWRVKAAQWALDQLGVVGQ